MSLPFIHPGLQKRELPLSVKAWHQMIAQDLVCKAVEAYRDPRDGHYQTMETRRVGGRLICTSVPHVELELSALFAATSGPVV